MTNQVIHFNEEQTEKFCKETDFSALYGNNVHVISSYLTKEIDTFIPGRTSAVIVTPNKNAICVYTIGMVYANAIFPFLCYNQGTSRQLPTKKDVRDYAERIIENYLVGSLYTTIIVLHSKEKQTKLVDELIYNLRSDNGTISEVVECFTPIAHIVKSLFNFVNVKLPVIKFDLNQKHTIHVKKVGNTGVRMALYEFDRNKSIFPSLLESRDLKGAMIFSGLFVETPVQNLLKLVNTAAKGKHKKDATDYVNGYLTELGHSDLAVSKWYKPIDTPKAKLMFAPLEKLDLGAKENKVVYMSKERGDMVVVINVDDPLVTEALNDRVVELTKADTDGDSPVEPMEMSKPTVSTGETNQTVNIVDSGEGVTMDKIAKGPTPKLRSKEERNAIMKMHRDINTKVTENTKEGNPPSEA